MRCPFCNHENLKVVDSRPVEDLNAIRRRRACEACGKRFTTYERVETLPVMIVKKDFTREVYDREKIEKGVLLACHKRPVSSKQITDLIDHVENSVFSLEKAEVDSHIVGELIMRALKDLDAVAYVRFASVYREFKDLNTFMDELRTVLNNN
ncbi:MAG: transcriptional regulator NrdR [Lachnospiraceae bacterium]